MNKNINVLTYPRCGSNYLYWLFYSSFNVNINKDHLIENIKLDNNNYIVTVLRDPLDALTSIITMESFYWRSKQKNKNNYVDLDNYIFIKLNKRIENYKKFFNLIPQYYNLMLHYDDINTYRENIVKHVSNETKIKIVNNNYVDLIYDNPSSYFLKSSKTSNEYEIIKEKVYNTDLSECYNIYNNLLKDCHKFI